MLVLTVMRQSAFLTFKDSLIPARCSVVNWIWRRLNGGARDSARKTSGHQGGSHILGDLEVPFRTLKCDQGLKRYSACLTYMRPEFNLQHSNNNKHLAPY